MCSSEQYLVPSENGKSNETGEKLLIGCDKKMNQYFIDRTASGKVDFQNGFAAKHMAPRLTDNAAINISIIADESSVELFADDGLTIMTEIFFPAKPYNQIHLLSDEKVLVTKLRYAALKGIW